MKTTRQLPHRLVAAGLTLALFTAACSSAEQPAAIQAGESPTTAPTTAPSTTTPSTTDAPAESAPEPAPERAPFEGESAENLDVDLLVQRLGARYEATEGKWPGFVPNDHPSVIALKDGENRTFKAIAINVSNPEDLGTAKEMDTAGTPFRSLHEITELNDDTQRKLDRMRNFEFHVTLGGVDSFAITAGPQLDASGADYAATFIHELFHRWQDEAFQPNGNRQDIAGYNYSKENIELATLEERALTAAINADSDEDRMKAARHYAALRLERSKDSRIILDNGQEQIEGTARYLEHITHTEGGAYSMNDFTSELSSDWALTQGVKDHFGFGRFYASGAAAIHLATLLGDDDALNKLAEGGAFPGDLVVAATGVTDADVERLLAEARATYDPDGSLAEKATEAAELATTESADIFGEDGTGGIVGDDFIEGEEDGESIELTEEQIECLESADLPDSGLISDEVFERCFGS